MKAPPQSPNRPFAEMLDWLRHKGAVFSKVSVVRNDQHQVTLVSHEEIEPDEIYIRVPHCCTMNAAQARQSAIGQTLLSSGVDCPSDHTVLGAYMLQERAKPASEWHPYLRALPQEYGEVPIFFGPETLVHLQGSYALDHILQRHRNLLNEYQALYQAVPEFRTFSLEDFRWVRTAINSRSFNFRPKEQRNVSMVPLIDFINHRMEGNGVWRQQEDGGDICCWARRRIDPGEEIFHNYGRKSTGRLFVAYGFVSADPRSDDARLVIVLDPGDPLYDQKRELHPALKRRYHYVGLLYDRTFQELLCLFRFLVIQHLDEHSTTELQNTRPVSWNNELAALGAFAQCCRASLALFPTSFDSDQKTMEKLRAAEPVDVNALQAVEVSWREKRVLLECLGFATEAQKLLKLPPTERLQRVDSLHPEARLKKYLSDTVGLEER